MREVIAGFVGMFCALVIVALYSFQADRQATKRLLAFLEHNKELRGENNALVEALLRQEGKAVPVFGGKRERVKVPGYYDLQPAPPIVKGQ